MCSSINDLNLDPPWQRAFRGWIGRKRSERTRRDYRRIGEQFLAFCGKAPGAVSAEDVQSWQAHLEQEGYAASTIRTYLATVQSFFGCAVEWGLVAANPVAEGSLPKLVPYESGRYLSEEEEAALLKAIDVQTAWGRRDYALILFLLRSGRKCEEVLGLRWGDFEVDKQGVRFRRGGKREKGGEEVEQWEKLDWEVWGAICRHLEGCGRLAGIGEEELIFTPLTDVAGRVEKLYGEAWQGHRLGAGSVGRLVQRYAGWAGLPAKEITPKALRYTAGVRKWQAGGSVEELQELLGHAEVESTRRWIEEFRSGNGMRKAAYRSQRRKQGARIGNSNADVLKRYLIEMMTTEGLSGRVQTRGDLRLEIWILRLALYRLVAVSMDVNDVNSAMRILSVIGRACIRIMRLIEAEQKLEWFDPVSEDRQLDQRYEELLEEERGNQYEAARRLIEEVSPRGLRATRPGRSD